VSNELAADVPSLDDVSAAVLLLFIALKKSHSIAAGCCVNQEQRIGQRHNLDKKGHQQGVQGNEDKRRKIDNGVRSKV
jgi:hypothetical protein